MSKEKPPARESVRREDTVSNGRRAGRTEITTRSPVIRDRIPTGTVEAEYIDEWGRKFVVRVGEGESPEYGMIVGPQPLDELELPMDYMIRLHNELYNRKLLTYDDVRRRPQDVQAALGAAAKIDVQTIQSLYGKYRRT